MTFKVKRKFFQFFIFLCHDWLVVFSVIAKKLLNLTLESTVVCMGKTRAIRSVVRLLPHNLLITAFMRWLAYKHGHIHFDWLYQEFLRCLKRTDTFAPINTCAAFVGHWLPVVHLFLLLRWRRRTFFRNHIVYTSGLWELLLFRFLIFFLINIVLVLVHKWRYTSFP